MTNVDLGGNTWYGSRQCLRTAAYGNVVSDDDPVRCNRHRRDDDVPLLTARWKHRTMSAEAYTNWLISKMRFPRDGRQL